MIGSSTAIGKRHKRVTMTNPGPPIPDGDGGWTQEPIPLVPPDADARIRPASLHDLERVSSGTVISQATHIVSIPFHPDVTTQTALQVEDYPQPSRTFSVVAVVNPEERDADLDLLCVEVVQ